MINQRIPDPTTTLIKTMVFLRLKRTLLLTFETKDKYDLRGVNDPDENKIRMKSRTMYSVCKVKVKVRSDERMRFHPLLQRSKLNKNKNKRKNQERTSRNSMLFQKYLPL
jgi:hypothetical protein